MNNDKGKRTKISESGEYCSPQPDTAIKKRHKGAYLNHKNPNDQYLRQKLSDHDGQDDTFIDAPIQKPEGRGRGC